MCLFGVSCICLFVCLGFGVWGSGLGVWGVGFGLTPVVRISNPLQVEPASRHTFRHSSIVFTRNISAPVSGCGFRVWSHLFRIWGFWLKGSGLGFGVVYGFGLELQSGCR